MALPIFQSFYPTAVKWINAAFRAEYRIIVDNRTGAPIGLVSPNANGPEGIWAPTPLTAEQIVGPDDAILADLNATYQLDEYPYSRYRSDGITLLPLDETGGEIIPPVANEIWFSPVTVTEENGPLIVQGGLRVIE